MIGYRLIAAAFLLAAIPLTAQAQRNYDVQTINFDLWCQETQHLPPDRCDKRLPEDVKTFEAFRAKIESYEIPYLQKQNNAARLDADVLHGDPVDPGQISNPPNPNSVQAPRQQQ